MDIDPQEIITSLPETSQLKTALVSMGTNIDSMQPTEELFLFINAYEEAQTAFNAGTGPETITTLRPATFESPTFDGDGNLTRTITRQLRFQEKYQVDEVNPIITF